MTGKEALYVKTKKKSKKKAERSRNEQDAPSKKGAALPHRGIHSGMRHKNPPVPRAKNPTGSGFNGENGKGQLSAGGVSFRGRLRGP